MVFETTESAQIVERTFRFVKKGGKIILYEIVPPEHHFLINQFDICRKDLQIIGSFSSVNICIITHELLASGVIQVEHLIPHRFLLQDWGKAIDTGRDSSKSMRAIVLMAL